MNRTLPSLPSLPSLSPILVFVAALAVSLPPLAAQCLETVPQGEGPYYLVGSPERSNLVIPGDGPLLTIHGRVLDTDCQPIPNCWIDVWHTDATGSYDTTSPDSPYRGHFYTDSAGDFTLETIVPGIYPGRTPHLHVKVQGDNTSTLTTQLYLPDHPLNATDILYDPALEITAVELTPDDDLTATFDFHVDSSCTAPTIASSPSSGTYPQDDVVSLEVEGTGTGPLEYQWRRDGVALTDSATLAGTSTDTLTLLDLAADDAASYDCFVTNACGTVTSEAAAITVGPPEEFRRGDCTDDGNVDLGDAITLLEVIFVGAEAPSCFDACDGNDDGALDVSDPVFVLNFLFTGGPAPTTPFGACGSDPTPDLIGCHEFTACP